MASTKMEDLGYTWSNEINSTGEQYANGKK